MNLQTKLILGVLLVILATVSLSTLGIIYLVGKQNDENGRYFVKTGMTHALRAMEDIKRKSAKRVVDFAGDPSSVINLKYLMEIKGRQKPDAYKFILERPKEEMIKVLATLGVEGGYNGFYVYDGKGDLVLYVQREEKLFESGFTTYGDNGGEIIKYQRTDVGYRQDKGWQEKPFVRGSLSRFPLPLPGRSLSWIDVVEDCVVLVGVVPFSANIAEQKGETEFYAKEPSEVAGCILYRYALDQPFCEMLRSESGMEVNVFVGQKLSCGTLPEFSEGPSAPDIMSKGLTTAEGQEIAVQELARHEYYRSSIPLYKRDIYVGAITLYYSRDDMLRKTGENIVMLVIIMMICMFLSIPVTIFMAGKLSSRIDAILHTVNEITGGNLNARVLIKAEDEIGNLATAFNQMTEDLQRHVEKLRESEQKYRDLFDHAPDGILITTLDGQILSFNDTAMKIFDYGDREAFSRLLATAFYQDPEKDRPELMRQLLREGWIENYEVAFKDRHDKPFTAGLSMRLVQFDGRTCIQTIMRDTTHIKAMEAELRAYSADLERMVGEKTAELKAANKQLLMAYRDAERMISELWNTKNELEKTNSELETVNSNLEQTREQLAIKAHQAGMAELAVSILHNIGNAVNSVNVRMHNLEEGASLKDIEALEKILGFIESEDVLDAKQGAPAERREKLLRYFRTVVDSLKQIRIELEKDMDFIRRGVDHIMEIIAIQQKYAGLRGFETPESVTDLLQDSLEMLMDSIRKRSISIELDLEPVPQVIVNKNKMMQVLINVLKNAYEAIEMAPPENEKKMVIRTSLDKRDGAEYVRVEVTDTGIGLAPDMHEKVFRFSYSSKGRGTGFGLHDAANYVRAHEGFIDLRSDGPGKGARLIIGLPITKGELS